MTQAVQVETLPRSVALVDLSYLFRKAWASPAAQEAEINTAPRMVLDELARVRDSVDHVILGADSPPYWRKEVYAEYKANRPAPSDGLLAALKWLRARVEQDGYQVAKAPTFEADDVIATLAQAYSQRGIEDVRIVGCDKDMMQLVGGPVRMFVPAVGDPEKGGRAEKLMDGPAVLEKYGVPPAMIVDYLTLIGDKSDNVPGCPKVGEVNAAKLIQDWGTLQIAINAARRNDPGIKPAIAKSLIDSADVLMLSRKLIQLRTDVPLDAEALLKRIEPQPIQDTRDVPDAEFERAAPKEAAEPVASSAANGAASATRPVAAAADSAKTEKQEDKAEIVRAEGYGIVSDELKPMDLRAVRVIAHWVANSRLYAKFNSIDAVSAVILRGRELGIGAMTALDGFHVVEGKPSASAQLIQSLAIRHPDCEYIMPVEVTATRAVVEVKHRRHPRAYASEYTIEQARLAELIKPRSGWLKFPEDMLYKMAMVRGVRRLFPEAILGLYMPEELGGEVREAA